MQFNVFFTASLLSGLSAAAPSTTSKVFQLTSIRSGSNAHLLTVGATQGSFFLNLPEEVQQANCDSEASGAFFQINDEGELQLYNKDNENTLQRAFTDRSGMGRGVFGYRTGDNLPDQFETKPWAINQDGHIEFDGNSGFIACPYSTYTGSFVLRIPTGVDNPVDDFSNCTTVAARVIEAENPVSCTYTQDVEFGSANNENESGARGAIASVFLYSMSYAIFFNAMVWVVPSELFLLFWRTKGMALAVASKAVVAIVLFQTTPLAITNVRWRHYSLFIASNDSAALFYFFFLPETSDKTLEEIAVLFGDDVVMPISQAEAKLGHNGEVYQLEHQVSKGEDA